MMRASFNSLWCDCRFWNVCVNRVDVFISPTFVQYHHPKSFTMISCVVEQAEISHVCFILFRQTETLILLSRLGANQLSRDSYCCRFQCGERNLWKIVSGVNVGVTCKARLWLWTGLLSFAAGRGMEDGGWRTSLTRLAERGSWGLLYRNDETRYQWSHPPLSSIHPKRLWVALATLSAVSAWVCMCV